MRLTAGLLLALGSAIGLNWGFFTQHTASNALPPISLKRPMHSLAVLFTSRQWLLGYGVGLGGWGLYIIALYFAPLSLVQAASAGGVGLLALLVWRLERHAVSRRDASAVVVSLLGLALLLVSFAAGVPHQRPAGELILFVWVGAAAAAAGLACLLDGRPLRVGAGIGAAAGLLYAAGDISTKGAVTTSPLFVPLLLGCLLLGFVLLQLAFQRGPALATAGMSTLLNNTVPIVAGIAAFHERLPAGGFGVLRGASFFLVVVGAVLLARPESSAKDRDRDVAEHGPLFEKTPRSAAAGGSRTKWPSNSA